MPQNAPQPAPHQTGSLSLEAKLAITLVATVLCLSGIGPLLESTSSAIKSTDPNTADLPFWIFVFRCLTVILSVEVLTVVFVIASSVLTEYAVPGGSTPRKTDTVLRLIFVICHFSILVILLMAIEELGNFQRIFSGDLKKFKAENGCSWFFIELFGQKIDVAKKCGLSKDRIPEYVKMLLTSTHKAIDNVAYLIYGEALLLIWLVDEYYRQRSSPLA